MVWQGQGGSQGEIVEFTQKVGVVPTVSASSVLTFRTQNIVAAVAAETSALPSRQRLSPSDLFFPADSLTQSYALTLTLAALFSHASVAINSVAGPGVDLTLATRSIAPTVVVASAETAASLHSSASASITSGPKKLAHYMQTRALAAGRMPVDGLLTRLSAPARAAVGSTPGKLRLLFVSERAGAGAPALGSAELSDLRVYTGARVVYALTAARVAGAVAQTGIYDYRREEGGSSSHGHFGAPLSSVEVKVVDVEGHRTTDERDPEGEVSPSRVRAANDADETQIVVEGPAVAGGKASLGVTGTFREDGTLAYV